MKHECSIVRDLLPLYVEDMVSQDTAEFVGGHLADCQACREEYQHLKQPAALDQPPQEAEDVAPLRQLKKKLIMKRAGTALLAGILAVVVLLSAFAILSAPRYFPYTPQLLEVTRQADGSLTVIFDQAVTQCRVDRLGTQEPDGHREAYTIQAWTSPWDRWFSHSGVRILTISPQTDDQVLVYYAQNNGQEDVLVYGDNDDGGLMTLPRLMLGYYLLLAAGVFVVLLMVWLAVKKKPQVRRWVERGLLLPVSYAVGHGCVLGFSTVSYSATRDFILIVAIGALVYCGLLLAGSLWKLWGELKSTR